MVWLELRSVVDLAPGEFPTFLTVIPQLDTISHSMRDKKLGPVSLLNK